MKLTPVPLYVRLVILRFVCQKTAVTRPAVHLPKLHHKQRPITLLSNLLHLCQVMYVFAVKYAQPSNMFNVFGESTH